MKIFNDLIIRFNASANPDKYFSFLIKQYCNKGRHYHNLQHIVNCLEEFKTISHLSKNSDIVEFALWYHDVIYYTKHLDNEGNLIPVSDNKEKSALIACYVAKELGITEQEIKKINDLILATKHDHEPKNIDEKLIVDVDLSILGQPEETYKAYELGIRNEYYWMKDKQFNIMRSQFLQSLLKKTFIYNTNYFKNKYEAKARKNLERSLFLFSFHS